MNRNACRYYRCTHTCTLCCCACPQDEVGVRLTQVQPGGPDWRAMNLMTQFYSQAQYL